MSSLTCVYTCSADTYGGPEGRSSRTLLSPLANVTFAPREHYSRPSRMLLSLLASRTLLSPLANVTLLAIANTTLTRPYIYIVLANIDTRSIDLASQAPGNEGSAAAAGRAAQAPTRSQSTRSRGTRLRDFQLETSWNIMWLCCCWCAVFLTLAAPGNGLDKDDPKVDGKSKPCYTFSHPEYVLVSS